MLRLCALPGGWNRFQKCVERRHWQNREFPQGLKPPFFSPFLTAWLTLRLRSGQEPCPDVDKE